MLIRASELLIYLNYLNVTNSEAVNVRTDNRHNVCENCYLPSAEVGWMATVSSKSRFVAAYGTYHHHQEI